MATRKCAFAAHIPLRGPYFESGREGARHRQMCASKGPTHLCAAAVVRYLPLTLGTPLVVFLHSAERADGVIF